VLNLKLRNKKGDRMEVGKGLTSAHMRQKMDFMTF
jgi:hypothetical protein